MDFWMSEGCMLASSSGKKPVLVGVLQSVPLDLETMGYFLDRRVRTSVQAFCCCDYMQELPCLLR